MKVYPAPGLAVVCWRNRQVARPAVVAALLSVVTVAVVGIRPIADWLRMGGAPLPKFGVDPRQRQPVHRAAAPLQLPRPRQPPGARAAEGDPAAGDIHHAVADAAPLAPRTGLRRDHDRDVGGPRLLVAPPPLPAGGGGGLVARAYSAARPGEPGCGGSRPQGSLGDPDRGIPTEGTFCATARAWRRRRGRCVHDGDCGPNLYHQKDVERILSARCRACRLAAPKSGGSAPTAPSPRLASPRR